MGVFGDELALDSHRNLSGKKAKGGNIKETIMNDLVQLCGQCSLGHSDRNADN